MHKLIVALDVDTVDVAAQVREALRDLPVGFKVGPKLLMSMGFHDLEGPPRFDSFDRKAVMLDLKLHEIPSIMVATIENIAMLYSSVWAVTLHGASGPKALRKVADSAAVSDGHLLPLAVTVLTTMANEECFETYNDSVAGRIARLVHIIQRSGIRGIVCSSKDLSQIRLSVDAPSDYTFVTPGVRPSWYFEQDDQVRAATPKEAILAGADHIVVGRPILRPPKGMTRREAAERILEEIS